MEHSTAATTRPERVAAQPGRWPRLSRGSVSGPAALRLAVTGAAYVLIFVPVLLVVATSFFSDEIVQFPPTSLTLDWYVNAWSKREFARGFELSFRVALIATLIGVPLGAAASLALVRSNLPAKGAISTILLGPLALPGVVAGAAVFMFYLKLENALDIDVNATMPGLVAAHVLLTIPWTVRLVTASLAGLDRAPEEAAANLGAGPWTVFRRITLPAMKPGIVAAAVFAFIASFENLEITMLLVGPGNTTLPVAMLNYLEFRMDPTLAAVATVQVALVGLLMIVTDRFVGLSRIL